MTDQQHTNLHHRVAELHRLRQLKERLHGEVGQAHEQILETDLGKRLAALKKEISDLADEIDRIDTETRAHALLIHATTGNTQPHPGVKIAIHKVPNYDESEALDYAREHLPQAVKLDKRKFDKFARDFDLEFVTVVEEPRARVDRDLGPALDKSD